MKIYRSTERGLLGSLGFLLLVVVLAALLTALTHDLLKINPALVVAVWLACGYFLVRLWLHMVREIIVTDCSIARRTPLDRYEIPWEEIIEVGTYRRVMAGEGPAVDVMVYLQPTQLRRRLVINVSNVRQACELISVLFEKATKAKFVRIENRSRFPFFRQMNVTEWKRHDDVLLVR